MVFIDISYFSTVPHLAQMYVVPLVWFIVTREPHLSWMRIGVSSLEGLRCVKSGGAPRTCCLMCLEVMVGSEAERRISSRNDWGVAIWQRSRLGQVVWHQWMRGLKWPMHGIVRVWVSGVKIVVMVAMQSWEGRVVSFWGENSS